MSFSKLYNPIDTPFAEGSPTLRGLYHMTNPALRPGDLFAFSLNHPFICDQIEHLDDTNFYRFSSTLASAIDFTFQCQKRVVVDASHLIFPSEKGTHPLETDYQANSLERMNLGIPPFDFYFEERRNAQVDPLCVYMEREQLEKEWMKLCYVGMSAAAWIQAAIIKARQSPDLGWYFPLHLAQLNQPTINYDHAAVIRHPVVGRNANNALVVYRGSGRRRNNKRIARK